MKELDENRCPLCLKLFETTLELVWHVKEHLVPLLSPSFEYEFPDAGCEEVRHLLEKAKDREAWEIRGEGGGGGQQAAGSTHDSARGPSASSGERHELEP
eukprot:8803937-Pyramimonas_sp.AAC.1